MKTLHIAFATMALTIAGTAYAADPQVGTGETNGYKLVWQDLFDADEIDPMRWDIEVNGNGGGNNELQYYTDREENIRLGDDGKGNHCLIITARREDYRGKAFTSGRMTSRARTVFTHGKVEAAIKFPTLANGLWPAFWMMGNDIDQVGWPKCGEIDIVEMGHQNGIKNGTQDRFFNGACHWGQAWPQHTYAKDKTASYSVTDGEFHIFTCIWDEQSIAMYLDLDKYPDQQPYYKMDIPGTKPEDSWPGNYFHKDNFILFNLAIGGNFPGIWDASGITALNEANGQEAKMYVNYVKIYQKGTSDETFFAMTESDPQPADPNAVQTAQAEPRVYVECKTVFAPGAEKIEVFNMGGELVASAPAARLDLCHLPCGCYVVKASDSYVKICL